MSYSRVSYWAQLSAATSSLVSSFIATICRNERETIPIVILKTLVQLPFVCIDGLTLFFMAMLNLVREERVIHSLSTGTVRNYPTHQLFNVWTSCNHKNGQRRGKNSCVDRA